MSKRSRRNAVETERAASDLPTEGELRAWIRWYGLKYDRALNRSSYLRYWQPMKIEIFNWTPIYPKVDDFWRATA